MIALTVNGLAFFAGIMLFLMWCGIGLFAFAHVGPVAKPKLHQAGVIALCGPFVWVIGACSWFSQQVGPQRHPRTDGYASDHLFNTPSR